MQPYAPVTLPFSAKETEKASVASVLGEPGARGKDEIFLMQFPRVLSIVPKEGSKKKMAEDHKEQSTFDLFKQIRGKVGKVRVYKSGKVEMEIEGIKYTIDQGIQSKMRQEVAAVDKDCRDIYLLGEVAQKMVVTPNIDFLLNTDQEANNKQSCQNVFIAQVYNSKNSIQMLKYVCILLLVFAVTAYFINSQCSSQEFCGDPSIERLVCENGFCKGTQNNLHCNYSVSSPSQCATGFYCHPSGYCDSCMKNCVSCENAFSCSTCATGFFYDSLAHACVQGPENCRIPTSATTCAQCDNGLQAVNGVCKNGTIGCDNFGVIALHCRQCKTKFYATEEGNCAYGPLNCDLPLSETTCIRCSEGYYLDPITKVCKLGLRNCRVPADNKTCVKCVDGYFWNSVYCQLGIPACKTPDSDTSCLKCYDGYYFNEKTCIPGPVQCKTPSSAVRCLVCFDGYFVTSSGACQKGPINCKTAISADTCSGCIDGFFWNGTHCVIGPANCKTPLNSTACLECVEGYYVYFGGCVFGIANCQYMTITQGCTNCLNGYYLTSDNACEKGPDNCYIATNQTHCARCLDGYYLDSTSTSCVSTLENCASISLSGGNPICTLCKVGYYLDISTKTCKKCTLSNCLACTSASTCVACATGYVLSSNNNCIPCLVTHCSVCSFNTTCDTCMPGFFWNETIMECTTCAANCAGCVSYTNCTICNEYYYVNSERECSKCPNGCLCVDQDRCKGCSDGYFLTSNFTCESCSQACKTCSGAGEDKCTSCHEGQELKLDGKCECMEGYEPNARGIGCVKVVNSFGEKLQLTTAILLLLLITFL
eukprot:TRINITY_DN331_c0_g1_i1.p1 TRINITY_DN331_c0_g1~~TRINITY_DN331_c0_g1_i1.p1  ORF type:complete len:820 (-),score=27.01 TRINITY_DN331_c0_g1_i1:1300-3759(-)